MHDYHRGRIITVLDVLSYRRSITDQFINKLCSSSCETPSIITRAVDRPRKNLLANTPNGRAPLENQNSEQVRARAQHDPLRDIDKPSLPLSCNDDKK
ncbi:Uncharacterized protein FWK35_00011316 [Aphis craccivora]|uniref:Uncharacterized protein n=1 Tax=Aphis craccivora TaxID=307492 RepID=A0A6G0Z6E3_APHCR|nr:Uncharacterized protein FWK35_00011316 [Aphis craccivora]